MKEERKRILNMIATGKITVEEGEELLDALGVDTGPATESMKQGGEKMTKDLKFIRVTVESAEKDHVDVRVPLNLLRAGMRFTSLIPSHAVDEINSSMKQAGMAFDLNNLAQEDIETLISSLGEMKVNVDSKEGDKVRIYCE
jgi:hypothetical protein